MVQFVDTAREPSGNIECDQVPSLPHQIMDYSAIFGQCVLDALDTVRLIGKGSYGNVFFVRHKVTGVPFAMKVMNKVDLVQHHSMSDVHSEKDILTMLSSQCKSTANSTFIVNLHCAFHTADRVHLVMDFVSGGEFTQHLAREYILSEDATRFYAAELLVALETLHNKNIAHRDIKPENLLLDADGHLVLTDFGLAKSVLGLGDRKHSWCGSEDYMAPETLAREPHTGTSVDWWAFGIFIYDCLVGSPPFSRRRERGASPSTKLHERIMKCKYRLPKYLSRECHSLIRGLLVRDPRKRLTDPLAVRSHPWFANVDWSKVRAKELTPPIAPVFDSPVPPRAESQRKEKRVVGAPEPKLRTMSVKIGSKISNVTEKGGDESWDEFTWVAEGAEAHFGQYPVLQPTEKISDSEQDTILESESGVVDVTLADLELGTIAAIEVA